MRTSALSVAEYMTRAPCTASPKESLASARRLMDEHAIRHLAVESGGKLVGILSDRDLQLVWTLAHAPPDVLTVEDAMTPDPYTVRPNAPLDEVVRVMAERKIGSAVVLERGRIVGVFTSIDAMNALSDVLRERRGASPSPERGALARMRSSVTKTARLPDDSVVDDALAAVMGALAERLTAGEAHQLLDASGGRSFFDGSEITSTSTLGGQKPSRTPCWPG